MFRTTSLVLMALLPLACGGSASETPFPEEPLPDYVTKRAETEPPGSTAPTDSASTPSSKPLVSAEPRGDKPHPADKGDRSLDEGVPPEPVELSEDDGSKPSTAPTGTSVNPQSSAKPQSSTKPQSSAPAATSR